MAINSTANEQPFHTVRIGERLGGNAVPARDEGARVVVSLDRIEVQDGAEAVAAGAP